MLIDIRWRLPLKLLAAPAAAMTLAVTPAGAAALTQLAQVESANDGVCLVYGIARASYVERRLTKVAADIGAALTADPAIAVSGLTPEGELLEFTLTDPSTAEAARLRLTPVVTAEPADLELAIGNDGQGTVRLADGALERLSPQLIEKALPIVARRVAGFGIGEEEVRRLGDDRISIAAAGVSNVQQIDAVIRPAGLLTFHLGVVPPGQRLSTEPQAGEMRAHTADGMPYVMTAQPAMDGSVVETADAVMDGNTNSPVVTFRFSEAGTRQFAEITAANVGKAFAIVMDGRVYAAPIIREPITGGVGQVSGDLTMDDAETIAALLRSGSLPADLALLWQGPVASCATLDDPANDGSNSARPKGAG